VGLLIRVIPYATVAVAAVLPLAAGLYLLTTTAWSVAERAILGRRLLPPTRGTAAPDPDRPALA
jgi:YidC/Oxa1 family membrane protein insertase